MFLFSGLDRVKPIWKCQVRYSCADGGRPRRIFEHDLWTRLSAPNKVGDISGIRSASKKTLMSDQILSPRARGFFSQFRPLQACSDAGEHFELGVIIL